MRFAESIVGLVGRTPLVRINKVISSKNNTILAKLEQFNPCGSVKDRAALSMIDDAEQKGILSPGGMVIEATSGNTGVALAFICAARGYHLTVVMPDSMTMERRKLLKLFGAQVELTPAHFGMRGSIDLAIEICNRTPGAFLVNQFENEANAQIHEQTTAREILDDTENKVDVIVVGIGTGGTISGIGREVKRHLKAVKIVGVEPSGSAVLSGGPIGGHVVQGIGAGFIPAILDRSVIDRVITVSDAEALAYTRDIIQKEGILAGISSGASLCAAEKYIREVNISGATVVVIFPDTGERYISVSSLFTASENR